MGRWTLASWVQVNEVQTSEVQVNVAQKSSARASGVQQSQAQDSDTGNFRRLHPTPRTQTFFWQTVICFVFIASVERVPLLHMQHPNES